MTKRIIIPYFQELGLKFKDVEPYHIQNFYLKQLERVSANSVIHYHAVIHRALKYAVKTRMIATNPVDLVDRPKKEVFRGEFYSDSEFMSFLKSQREQN